MEHRRNPLPTVDIIIRLANRGIVLIKRRNPPPAWALPGSLIYDGEAAAAAADRVCPPPRRAPAGQRAADRAAAPGGGRRDLGAGGRRGTLIAREPDPRHPEQRLRIARVGADANPAAQAVGAEHAPGDDAPGARLRG